MRANLTLLFFLYLSLVFAWRSVSKAPRIQKAIHHVYLGAGMQWYALLLLGCAAMVSWTLQEFFQSYYGLDQLEVLDNLERAHAMSDSRYAAGNMTFAEFKEHFSMPTSIQRFNMVSNLVGIPVVVVAAAHIIVKFAHPGMKIVQARMDLEASATPWWPAPRMNRLITLMLMPVMLSVMSMRGSCRIWALTTGQAENHFHTSFEKVEKWEIALYNMDQEVGQMFQFFSVYCFCRICGSFLNESLGEVAGESNHNHLAESAKELRRLVRNAGFLPAWAFIAVGVVRCFLEFVVAESHYYEVLEESATLLESSVLNAAGTIFSFLTILCVINMLIVGRTKTIKERLGNANLKFMGARALLLIIAVQEKAAQALTRDSAMHQKLSAKAADRGVDISWVSLTPLQADLVHLSLLNFECLFVVVFNTFVWRDLDLHRTGVANYGYSNLPDSRELETLAEDVDIEAQPQEDSNESITGSFEAPQSSPLLLGAQTSGKR